MSSRAKYIIFESATGSPFVVVFTAAENHSDMARKIGMKVTSAGLLTLVINKDNEVEPSCIPGSVTLGIPLSLDKAEEDNTIVSIFLTKN